MSRTEMNPAHDLACMARLQTGDRDALSELYDRHSSLMFGLALRIVRDRTDAEDVLQEAWIQAWNRCNTFDPSRGSVAAWLVTIARTRALDRLRRRAARDRAASDSGTEQSTGQGPQEAHPETAAERSDIRETVSQALGRLDPNHRLVLEIAYFEGLSQSEIATRVGKPIGTVKYWTRQGLMKLKELMPEDAT